jgi:flagellar biosynthesis anti-sigma factor FlgM
MRINLNQLDQQAISNETAKKPSAITANQVDFEPSGESVGLSQDKVTLSSLATQALAQPEVRQGLVDNLRHRIDLGDYTLDPRSIAEAMLNENE